MLEIVEREAEVRARVIADASRIEAEIDRRAEERAQAYGARSFALVSQSESAEPADPADTPSGPRLVATREEACPEAASRPDTTLGWPARRESGIRRLGRR